MMADIIRSAKPLRRAKYVCMEGADKLVGVVYIIMTPVKALRTNNYLAKWFLWYISKTELGHGL